MDQKLKTFQSSAFLQHVTSGQKEKKIVNVKILNKNRSSKVLAKLNYEHYLVQKVAILTYQRK